MTALGGEYNTVNPEKWSSTSNCDSTLLNRCWHVSSSTFFIRLFLCERDGHETVPVLLSSGTAWAARLCRASYVRISWPRLKKLRIDRIPVFCFESFSSWTSFLICVAYASASRLTRFIRKECLLRSCPNFILTLPSLGTRNVVEQRKLCQLTRLRKQEQLRRMSWAPVTARHGGAGHGF